MTHIYPGLPLRLDPVTLENTRAEAMAATTEESDRTRAGFNGCPDPATSSQQSSSSGLQRLKDQFEFLKEYTDEFILSTGVDVLIKAEAAARKLKKLEKEHKAEDKLFLNRESLPMIKIPEGWDNRLDSLHPARVMPGATCSAAKLWLHARRTLGNSGHTPVSSYDMAAIGLGGCVSARGWVEIHSPASPTISIKMFSMGSSASKPSGSRDDDFPELEDLADFKSAVRVLRGAMSYVHPWNQSIAALENFFILSNYCSKDLVGMDRHAQLLSRFTDYILGENASRWRNIEPFLDTKDLRGAWAEFLSQKSSSYRSRNQGGSNQKFSRGFSSSGQGTNGPSSLPSSKFNLPAFLFNDDICVKWNLGLCLRKPGTCTNKKGTVLRHVCNWRPDLSKPNIPCARDHMATAFHR